MFGKYIYLLVKRQKVKSLIIQFHNFCIRNLHGLLGTIDYFLVIELSSTRVVVYKINKEAVYIYFKTLKSITSEIGKRYKEALSRKLLKCVG